MQALTAIVLSCVALASAQVDCGSRQYLADPEDCHHFYECSNGVPVRLSCPADLYFNPQIDTCDYIAKSTATCYKSSEKPKAAEVKCGSAQYLVDPGDCHYFYECSNDEPVKMECPKNLLFNSRLNVCDFAYNVSCK